LPAIARELLVLAKVLNVELLELFPPNANHKNLGPALRPRFPQSTNEEEA